jgi:hypothetical protein
MRFKAAKASDFCETIATLIWSEDPVLMRCEYGDFDAFHQSLAAECAAPISINSHTSTWLAFEAGEIVGLLNGFPAADYDRLSEAAEAIRIARKSFDKAAAEFAHLTLLYLSHAST